MVLKNRTCLGWVSITVLVGQFHRNIQVIYLTNYKIVFAIEKNSDYSITNVKRGVNGILYCKNLPFEKYYRLKDKLRLTKRHLTN